MIDIMFCCEGSTDIEVIQYFIKKLSSVSDLCFNIKKRNDIQGIKILGPKYSNHSAVSRKIAQLAKSINCNFIAYHQDEDNKGFEYMYGKVKSYFSLSEEKGMTCIAIVPQHMTESWLLTDEIAFEKIFGKKPNNPILPSKPEETWGNKGTEKHPKTIMAQVLAQYHSTISSETYSNIAQNTNIAVLQRRCPKSFGQFYKDMQSFISEGAAQ
jgi:hypothetical protein